MSTIAALPDSEHLAEANLDLVELVMRKTRRSWRSFERDDVMGAAFEGLTKAARRYRADLHPSFRAWATMRIKGAILDFIREEVRFQRVKTVSLEMEIDSPKTGGSFAVDEPLVKPVLRIAPKTNICTACKHESVHHHAQFGCMDWRKDRTGSGYCACDGMRVR